MSAVTGNLAYAWNEYETWHWHKMMCAHSVRFHQHAVQKQVYGLQDSDHHLQKSDKPKLLPAVYTKVWQLSLILLYIHHVVYSCSLWANYNLKAVKISEIPARIWLRFSSCNLESTPAWEDDLLSLDLYCDLIVSIAELPSYNGLEN